MNRESLFFEVFVEERMEELVEWVVYSLVL